jgi:hypothetical protein
MFKQRITPEEFVVLWNTSNRVESVVEKSGLTMSTVLSRARRYRAKGVKLKFFGPILRDVERINELKALAAATAEVWDIDKCLDKYDIDRSIADG